MRICKRAERGPSATVALSRCVHLTSNSTNSVDGLGPFDATAGAVSTVPIFLDGAEVVLSSTFSVNSPLDKEIVWTASSASVKDAVAAVESSQRAFATWSTSKINTRRDIFLRAAETMRKAKNESHHYAHTETGEPQTMFNFEFESAIEFFISVAGLLQTAVACSQPPVTSEERSALLFKEPYGVVLAIAPWNAPHALSVRSFLLPIAIGNTVVFKGPELAPKTTWAVVKYLHQAGLHPGVLNTLYHRPSDALEVTHTLIAHSSIRKINFTGSTLVGGIVAGLAGKYLKPTVMELGGKAPAIVCEDADLNLAALQCVLGSFLHTGQICMSTERIMVHTGAAELFRKALKTKLLLSPFGILVTENEW